MAPPEHKEWEPISWAWNPRLWKPFFRAVARRWRKMSDPVTDFGAAPWGYIVCANGSVRRGIVKAQVQVALGGHGYWIPVCQPCGLHGAGFPLNTILLSVEIKCDRGSRQEHLGGSLHGYDAAVIMKLDIAEAELGGAAV